MTNVELARSYMEKAEARLAILEVLHRQGDYSDVVREAQEIVELALKAMLRYVGIEPPKWHDVGGFLVDHEKRFPPDVRPRTQRLREISSWLRKERELAFYGEEDFIPSEQYSSDDSMRAMKDARFVVETARQGVDPSG